MDIFKKFFPLSFKRTDTIGNLIVVGFIAGVLIGLSALITGWIPVVGAIIGWILGIASSLIEIYVLAGIIIQILVFAKVLK